MRFLKKFLNNESGATAIEYGLIAALIAIAAIAALQGLSSAAESDSSVQSEESSAPNN